jgi:FixJ family two-component response regulator
MPRGARVFVIDDDVEVRSSLKSLLESAGLRVEIFPSAMAFLQRPDLRVEHGPSCLVLDLQLLDLRGLEVQERLANAGNVIPIVFVTGQADVPSAAKAMRDGAVDFLVKPVDDSALLDAVARALTRATEAQQRLDEHNESAARIALLTTREGQVVALVARGLLNKQIAFELGISEETVKVHRRNAMRKLEVDSVPALVRLLDRAIT